MKNYIKYILALLLILGLGACRKFVDIKKSSSQALLQTTDDCQYVLDNYISMNTGYPNDGEISSDDYYLTDIGYLSSGLNQDDRDIYGWLISAIRPGAVPQWQNPYKTIFSANIVLETLNGLKAGVADPAVVNVQKGSALFYRAFAFWQVAQLYARPYDAATAGQGPGIPLRLSSDINDKSERGTVEQTYGQIIKDLKDAIGLLPLVVEKPTRPDKVAAYAMLARTYLSMGDYSNALANANAALDLNPQLIDFNTLNAGSNNPFNPRFNKEVIFHALMSASTNPANNVLNPVNSTTGARIDMNLAASYDGNDLRKKIFLKQNNSSVMVRKTPTSPDSTSISVPDGTYRFTGNYEGAASAVLFIGLAVDEMYLISAECYARLGDKDNALIRLNALLKTRYSNTVPYVNLTAATPSNALGIILLERRKELLMRGLRWSDTRRLNLTLTRQTKMIVGKAEGSVSNGYTVTFTYPATATYNLPTGDPRFTLLIPQQVINDGHFEQNSR